MNKQWFAVRTRSNREWTTAGALTGQGYETFLPLYEPDNSREGSVAQKPLFPGYVFCRFDVTNRLPILQNSGVVHIVSIGRTPAPLEDQEVESLKIVVQSPSKVDHYPEFVPGKPVMVTEGPLRGATGTIVRDGADLLVVSISLLQRSVCITIPKLWADSAVPSTYTH
jgi:transcriptional antiterminator NusG